MSKKEEIEFVEEEVVIAEDPVEESKPAPKAKAAKVDVLGIQKALLAWGCVGTSFTFADEKDEEPIMTEATVQGIKNFQEGQGLPMTGEVDKDTAKVLFG